METKRQYDTRHGSVTLRPEHPADDAFLFELFRGHAIGVLQLVALPPDMIEKLLAFQYASQTQTHRRQFPDAVFSIIESNDAPIGRLIEADEGDAVYFVDFALLPDRQAKGLGTAFIEMVADEWATRGRDARVEVVINNQPSLKLCHKLGFVESTTTETGFVELRRRAPGRTRNRG
jgi:GNAT superfamily N-acetyltransferase